VRGHLVLLGFGDQVDRRHRRPGHLRGHLDQGEQVGSQRVGEDPVLADLGDTRRIRRVGGRHHHPSFPTASARQTS
jgi:hypothetical protein